MLHRLPPARFKKQQDFVHYMAASLLISGTRLSQWCFYGCSILKKSALELSFLLSFLQSLQNSSYNHFAAIYYLLLERLKEYRNNQLSNRSASSRPQRPRSSDFSTMEVSLCSAIHKATLTHIPPLPLPFLFLAQYIFLVLYARFIHLFLKADGFPMFPFSALAKCHFV